jgi:hypothetical protein
MLEFKSHEVEAERFVNTILGVGLVVFLAVVLGSFFFGCGGEPPAAEPELHVVPELDNIRAASSDWTFTDGLFGLGVAGGDLIVSGTAHPENSGTFRIVSLPDGADLVTTGGPFVDELFGPGVHARVVF